MHPGQTPHIKLNLFHRLTMYYVGKYWQTSQKTKGVLYFFAPMLWPVKGRQTRFTNTSQVLLLMIDHWLFLFAALYYMIQHFRSRRAMTGQRMSSLMERWGVKSFFAKHFFADLWTMICFCVFYVWTDGEPGASLSASDFFETKYTRVYMYIHEYIYYCKPFTPKYGQRLHRLFIEKSQKCFEMKLSTVLPLPKGERACVPLSKCEAVSLGTR